MFSIYRFLYVAFFFSRGKHIYAYCIYIYIKSIYIYIYTYYFIRLPMTIFFCHRLCVSCLGFDFFPQTKSGWFGQGHFRAGTLLSIPHRFGGGVPKRPSTLAKKRAQDMVGDGQNTHFWDTVHVVCSPKVIFVGNVRVHDPLVTIG